MATPEMIDGRPESNAESRACPLALARHHHRSCRPSKGPTCNCLIIPNTSHSFNSTVMARRRRPPRPGALADLSPSRILKQMALLQFFYYGVAIVLIVFTTFVAGRHPDTKAILDWRELRGDVTTGWTLALCWLLGSLITYVSLSHSGYKSASANIRLLEVLYQSSY